jgi:hypothetical protein
MPFKRERELVKLTGATQSSANTRYEYDQPLLPSANLFGRPRSQINAEVIWPVLVERIAWIDGGSAHS